MRPLPFARFALDEHSIPIIRHNQECCVWCGCCFFLRKKHDLDLGPPKHSAAHLQVAGKTWVERSQHVWEVAKAVWPQDDALQYAWVDDVLHRLRHEGGEILDEVWKALPTLPAAALEQVVREYPAHSGMRWTESGRQSIATLRTIHRSGRWQEFWNEDPWSQLVPLSRRIAAWSQF
ncbi:MAG: hypothetical protein C7B46_03480 [Sulfobacillus benefaciens]|uniref:Uncharacterized protein n=1 Tax=Sulfobacillus benefaciens TaxID=453960 RepID=A0A2T2XJW1_9FIRM|nr:MAG: hypothetical protein C7B46_03480 [Sulfobacillus benefaciens]